MGALKGAVVRDPHSLEPDPSCKTDAGTEPKLRIRKPGHIKPEYEDTFS
jgi:hypothetical protein